MLGEARTDCQRGVPRAWARTATQRGAVVEIPVMMYSSRLLRRFGPVRLLLAAMVNNEVLTDVEVDFYETSAYRNGNGGPNTMGKSALITGAPTLTDFRTEPLVALTLVTVPSDWKKTQPLA